MNRFFVLPECIVGEEVVLSGEVVHRISRVLRMVEGDEVILIDNSGLEYHARLRTFSGDVISGEILSAQEGLKESQVQISLYLSLLKADKFDWVLQKGTELGIAEFVPVVCERSAVDKKALNSDTRLGRWNKIVIQAVEQCGRSRIPIIHRPTPLTEALEHSSGNGLSLMPWEREHSHFLGRVLKENYSTHLNIFIGPEGGFTGKEADLARSYGVVTVSLGKRVLRSETAAIVAAAIVLFVLEELG